MSSFGVSSTLDLHLYYLNLTQFSLVWEGGVAKLKERAKRSPLGRGKLGPSPSLTRRESPSLSPTHHLARSLAHPIKLC